ncbi:MULTISPECIES: T9SS type A sorting domain-containing protein [Emticicia]|uniref:T9SS type A sorting domain-containing protein n=1 Tax=Emticicia TaxID=312278 RepID=UPI0007D8C810|nr:MULTISPECIES: T9SS type A sorting domain-containing protein [Emticicia]
MNRNLYAFLLILFSLTQQNVFSQADDWRAMINGQKVNFYEVQKLFLEELSKNPNMPNYEKFKEWEASVKPRIDLNGNILDIDLKEIENFEKNSRSRLANVNPNWRLIGPMNSPKNLNAVSLGRIDCIAFDSRDKNIFYVASPSGGVWKTENAGTTWKPISNDWTTPYVEYLTIDKNPDILYATGPNKENLYWKTKDAGKTWEEKEMPFVNPSRKNEVYRIYANPHQSNMLVAHTLEGIMYSMDGGDSWTKAIQPNGFPYSYSGYGDLEFHPTNPNIIYASLHTVNFTTGMPGIEFIVSEDGGKSYKLTKSFSAGYSIGMMQIAVSLAAPKKVYLLVSKNTNSSFDGVYVSSDEGKTFEKVSDENSIVGFSGSTYTTTMTNVLGGQFFHNFSLNVSPLDSNRIVLGAQGFLQTTNGGKKWESLIAGDFKENVHTDIQFIAFHPITNKVIVCNDGGLVKESEQYGVKKFESLSNTLATSQIYAMCQGFENPNDLTIGLQDNGYITTIDANNWLGIVFGDAMAAAISDDSKKMYLTNQMGRVFRANINFKSSNEVKFDNKEITPINSEYKPFVTRIVTYPHTFNKLLIGHEHLYKSSNAGESWTKLTLPKNNFTAITAFAIAPTDTSTLFAADERVDFVDNKIVGSMYRSLDGGKSWDISYLPHNEKKNAQTAIRKILPHPKKKNHLWVITNLGRVYQSTNNGNSWKDYSGSLPIVILNDIVVQNNSADALYLATARGVYYRDSTMNDWMPYNTGLPAVNITQLEINYRGKGSLRASSYGRGLWEADLMQKTVKNVITGELFNIPTCAGGNINIPFSIQGEFPAYSPNYIAEIAPLEENFKKPIKIGIASVSPVNAQFPNTLKEGMYQIRVQNELESSSFEPITFYYKPELIPTPKANDFAYCHNNGVNINTYVNGSDIKWYKTATDIAPISNVYEVLENQKGSISLYVSQTVKGCESDKTIINIKANNKPEPLKLLEQYQYCLNQKFDIDDLKISGENLQWISADRWVMYVKPTIDTKVLGNNIFYVRYKPSNFDCYSDISTVNIYVDDKPKAQIDGAATIQQNEETQLSVKLTGYSPWKLTLNNQTYDVEKSPFAIKVKGEKTQNYQLQSVSNICGTGLVSGVFQLTVIPITSLESIEKSRFKVYPNPVKTQLTIEFEGSQGNVTAELFNLAGKTIFSKTIKPKETIDFRDINIGVYLLKIKENNSVIEYKIVKE